MYTVELEILEWVQTRVLLPWRHNNYKASVLSEGQGFGPYVTRPFSAGHKMRLHFTYMYMIVCMQGSYGGGKILVLGMSLIVSCPDSTFSQRKVNGDTCLRLWACPRNLE